jgi:hypothetical protein
MKLEHKYQAGLKHYDAGRLKLAEGSLRAVCDANPTSAVARYGLAMTLMNQLRFRPASQAFAAAARLAPGMSLAHYGLAFSLYRLGELAEAEPAVRRALQRDPNLVVGWLCLSNILRQQNRLAEARAACEEAIGLAPNDAGARFVRGFQRLLEGDLAAGWPDYEYRPARQEVPDAALRRQWRGGDPAGQTLLLYGEQGVGDTLQFLRYAQPLAERGARVLVFVQPALMRLAARAPGVAGVVEPRFAPDGASLDLPAFDACCPLPSLPLYFGTDLGAIPAPARYVSPSPDRLDHWRAILGPDSKLTIALAWAGNPAHIDDHHRSIALVELAPLLRIEGVRWLSVQKGAAARALKPGPDIVNLDAQIRDFDDTAAILDLADLVITVDTAVCHLAGALGRPTWTLLPFAPDWRWLLGRTDSPWYPSMRLYRQPADRDWASVVARVATDLTKLVGGPDSDRS